MTHEIWASVVVRLPEEPQAMAQQVAAFATAWAAMLKAAGEAQLSGFSVNERGQPARVRGHNGAVRKRRRRTRAELSEAEAQAAVQAFPS